MRSESSVWCISLELSNWEDNSGRMLWSSKCKGTLFIGRSTSLLNTKQPVIYRYSVQSKNRLSVSCTNLWQWSGHIVLLDNIVQDDNDHGKLDFFFKVLYCPTLYVWSSQLKIKKLGFFKILLVLFLQKCQHELWFQYRKTVCKRRYQSLLCSCSLILN